MVLLISSDNEEFIVDREVAERSALIKNMLEDLGERDEPIPLHNVSSSVLKKVLEYCEHHRGEPLPAVDENRRRMTDIDEWDGQFITVDQEMLFEIILAANYLNIQPLIDLGCKTVANMIEGKTPEEIRKLFNIVDDSIPEEEEGIRKAMPVPEEEIHDPIPAPEEETSDPIPAPEVKIRDTIPAPEEEASDTILAPEEEAQMRAENVSPLMSKTGFLSKWRSWLRRKRVRVCG